MEIRLFKKGDTEQVAQLLHNTVKILDTEEYSEAQVQAWSPNNIHFRDWEETCLKNFTIVAIVSNTIIGIAQLESNGHINCFYCHQDFRRQGIGRQLYTALEEYAYSKQISNIYTETSDEESPFFLKMGFQKVQKQNVLIRGQLQTSFVIEKPLQT